MQNIRTLFLKHVGQTSDAPYELEVDRAKGIYIYDRKGKEYIDLISGIGPAAVGHCHPEVVAAGKKQMERYMHTMVYGEHIQAPQVALAEYIGALCPEDMESAYFVNSGAEAAEVAIKLGRKYTGRKKIVSCRSGYHGSTMGASALMSEGDFSRAFRPFMPGVRMMDWNAMEDLEQIDRETAAVIIETMQGEAGCRLPERQWLQELRDRCSEMGALLILDEIQVGLGRTGRPFGFQHYGLEPDLILLAKALGGGLPLGAVVGSRDIIGGLSSHPILGHCTTFGGNPVSCATGLAAVKLIMEGQLYKSAEKKAGMFREQLRDHPAVSGIRGKGLWMAVDVGTFERVQRLMWKAKEKGVITDWFLFNDHSFRICPPLVISETEVERAGEILTEVMDDLLNED